MGSNQTIEPQSPFVAIPSNYPSMPAPGKLELLWNNSYSKLYHELSPYDTGTKSGFTQQPFVYTYPDKTNTFPTDVIKYDTFSYPLGSATNDVIRVTKFLASGKGLLFLAKQELLQFGNSYNETRVYNPTSPAVAAGMGLALGAVRPQRNFDTSAGLAGILGSLIGSAIPDALFGTPVITPPAGTVASALPTATLTSGGKGLLRAGDANAALSNLQSAWTQNSPSSFTSTANLLASTLFNNTLTLSQHGVIARSDEGAYGLMIGAGVSNFSYVGTQGGILQFGQQWIAGGSVIRKKNQYPVNAYRLFVDQNGSPIQIFNDDLKSITIPQVGQVGYTVTPSYDSNSPGYRYGDNIGSENDDDYQASDIMVQYSEYANQNNDYPTKQTDLATVQQLDANLKLVLSDINNASYGTYTIAVPQNSRVISSGNPTSNGYDRLFATNQSKVGPINYPQGLLQDYRNVKVVDNSLTLNPIDQSLKLPGAGRFDAINTLNVLPSDKSITLSPLNGWVTWQPYVDDLIALYFYDVVNENYIPFRASITGLNEVASPQWEEMAFIGRADRLYSYSGFTRNLTFTLQIVISSIAELAPTWQRINYLMSLVKPANYTSTSNNTVSSRFMVPPMVMVTLGDMYKDQPILFQSIGVTIPDDATWETSNEFNSAQWKYLANYITAAPDILYGQLPRTVEIAMSMILLEKERPIVGGANFGNAPRNDNLITWNTTTVPSGGTPNNLNQHLVVKNPIQSFAKSTQKFQQDLLT